MLNKQICQKCHEGKSRWTQHSDEHNWVVGEVVFCCELAERQIRDINFEVLSSYIPIDSDPPECCPFILEHLVSK